jgi:hypothetical protein
MSSTRSLGIPLAAAMTLALSACGGDKTAGNAQESAAATGTAFSAPADDSAVAPAQSAAAQVPTLADGPDVCFKAIANHLGADAKVMEITSFFSAGSEIDSSDKEPQGQLTSCTVDYQDPSNPVKLIGTRMDVATGTFSAPHQIELNVSGDAANFKLDDYVVPLSQVDAAALAGQFEALKPQLEGVYSKYAWTGVRLSPPGAFSDVPTLRLDLQGRLAANDIKKGGYASVSLDGKTVVRNHLLP